MSVPTPATEQQHQDGRSPGRRALLVVIVVLACAAQVVVLLMTFVMGLGWGGLTWVVALLQAGAAFVLIAWLASRRRALVLLVPVLSAALCAGLFFAGYSYERATGCSGGEKAAVEALVPPPGTAVEFEGEYIEGCVARTEMNLAEQDIVEHYEAELTRLGWRQTPGEIEARAGTAAVKDGVQLTVQVEDKNMEGDGGQMLETVVSGGPTPSCLVNRVGNDERMTREPTDQVEPGQWMMFASSDDLPASVVVRDSSGAVIFEKRASTRPDDDDDLMAAQDSMPYEDMTLVLAEGAHEVECTSRDGVATVVPLRVAWDTTDGAETTKSVVLRVYELRGDRR